MADFKWKAYICTINSSKHKTFTFTQRSYMRIDDARKDAEEIAIKIMRKNYPKSYGLDFLERVRNHV